MPCTLPVNLLALERREWRSRATGAVGKLRFSSVDFSGELSVLDADLFSGALTRGVGHANAFGCGLLLVRRLG